MERVAYKSFRFSDGTVIPPNTFVAVASKVTHQDEGNYPSPKEFDGFRFAKMREEPEEESKHQLVSLELGFVGFGNGRNAWYVLISLSLIRIHATFLQPRKIFCGE
jgi:cytochrome P450